MQSKFPVPNSPGLDEPHPIHLSNTIQPHGMLMALDETDFSILQASTNAENYLGIPLQQLVGMPLDTLFDLSQTPGLLSQLFLVQNRVMPVQLTYGKQTKQIQFDGFIHRTNSTIILELEQRRGGPAHLETNAALAVNVWVRESIRHIRLTKTHHELLNAVVHKLKDLTGYDRVLIYAFDSNHSGEVIAEAKCPDLTAYLGLHFPATDIPTWVRCFYAQGSARAVPDMQADAVPLFPSTHPQTQKPLDLSLAVLRSPDACCVEYYGNMGMNATFVMPLLVKDQTLSGQTLWGLVACHHQRSAYLSYDVRASSELLVQVATAELESQLKQQDLEQQHRLHEIQSKLIQSMAQADNFTDGLIKPANDLLLNLVQATGAAVCLGKELTVIGVTPAVEQIYALIQWIENNIQENLFHTQCLSDVYPDAIAFKDVASGLLILKISAIQHHLILWFRPEVIQTISWGGNPESSVKMNETGPPQLSPRASFDRWEQTVYASSHPWQPFEVRSAEDFRQSIVGIVLGKTEEMAVLNLELQRSNRELTAFAYAAAHDLKEPLRGIYNYANILQEDYGAVLDAEGLDYLAEIQSFAQRMETLINALLRISQLRQTSLNLESVDLNELLDQTIELIHASQPDLDFEVRVPQHLPPLTCDGVLVREVFRNLCNNALKYNARLEKWIEIGWIDKAVDDSSNVLFYVQDNGIGIREEHLKLVFKLFKRLHPQESYGGGAGVGLTVVNQIIERHGGKIWVESELGIGSTFYFSLGPER